MHSKILSGVCGTTQRRIKKGGESPFKKQLSKVDPSLVNEGRVAGARTKIGMEDPGANFYARRHNSSMMSDALGVDFVPGT